MMPSLYGNYGGKDTIIHKTEHNILSIWQKKPVDLFQFSETFFLLY